MLIFLFIVDETNNQGENSNETCEFQFGNVTLKSLIMR